LSLRKAAVRLGQLLLLFVIGYYLVYRNLVLNWHSLDGYEIRLRWFPFLASLLAMSAIFVVNSQIWRRIVFSMTGIRLGHWRVAYIWFVSNLGRYLPGKLWQIAGMAVMARTEGIPAGGAAASGVLGIVICMLAGAVVGLVLFPAGVAGDYAYLLSWAWVGLPVALAFLHPWLLNRLLSLISRPGGKPQIQRKLRFGELVIWFVLNLGVWLAYGLSFHYFILSVIPDAGLSVSDSAGIYAVGYIIGFLAVFAPGGLGVRELLFVGLLAASLGELRATVVALISRIWLTLAELVPLSVMLLAGGLPGKMQAPISEKRVEKADEQDSGNHSDLQ